MLDLARNALGIGWVVAVYPQGQSIDVLMEDGTRLSNVQAMVPTGSDATGLADLPDIGLPSDNTRWNFNGNPERNVRAVIALYRANPICIGFLLPQITQMTFARKNFRVSRHASDVYTTVNDSGDVELYHPSGVFFRIAVESVHEDLTGQDVDQSWAIARNTAAQVHVHLEALGGTVLDIGPTGAVTLTAPTGVTVTAPTTFIGPMMITGDVTITGTVDITGLTSITGDLTVDGAVSFSGGAVDMTAAITLTGTLASSGDITAAGISLVSHPHLPGTYEVSGTPVTGSSGAPT